MVPWALSLFRPRLSYFIRGSLRRYIFWGLLILFGGPHVLKDEYAAPLIGLQKKVIHTVKSIGQTLTTETGK